MKPQKDGFFIAFIPTQPYITNPKALIVLKRQEPGSTLRVLLAPFQLHLPSVGFVSALIPQTEPNSGSLALPHPQNLIGQLCWQLFNAYVSMVSANKRRTITRFYPHEVS